MDKAGIYEEERFKMDVDEETVSYLQRLHYEVESYQSVVARLIENAKGSKDDSLLDSPTFKAYHTKMEEAIFSYDTAKKEFQNRIATTAGERIPFDLGNVLWSWSIDDFSIPEVTIVVQK